MNNPDTVLKQITALYAMSVMELKVRYQELFGETNLPSNKDYLIRRVAHKIQENAFGGLPASAQERLEALKVELNPLKNLGKKSAYRATGKVARRIPLPGTIIAKTYKGRSIEVKVLQNGFEYDGKPYKSLSRIAREVSGVHQSGFVFFSV